MKNKSILFFAAVAALMSCNRIEKISAPDDFDVFVETQEYTVGDTVCFNFKGVPDVISFYSGEVGNDYNFIGGRIAEPNYFFNFQEQCIDGRQENQLKVYISTDFDENYSFEGITSEKVHWTDISGKFNLLGPGKVTNNRKFTDVGNADLREFLTSDESTFYIAFNYVAEPYASGKDFNIIRTTKMKVFSEFNHGKKDLYTWNDFGWKMFHAFSQDPKRPSEVQDESQQLQFRVGWGNKPEGGTYQGDGANNWAVSKPITVSKVLDMGPDHAIGIKGVNDVRKEKYEHIFDYPGEYEVVFVGRNVNINQNFEKVVKLKITVKEKKLD